APFSKEGCLIFVKLNQFVEADSERVVINTNDMAWASGHGNLKVLPLHSFGTEHTALVKWPKGEKFIPHSHFGGEEIFVLSGGFKDEHGSYPQGTWMRSKHLSQHHPYVDDETIILVKTGHLLK
ncbi:MAG: cupin domain-containing protein, partial [Bdellovibrionales bacterium]|nr:cupin domain-containing protein [Bdellovibrionales bacterium]NQZ18004.1 cupin domain-containing protein [Bdellovibrionales bacterium]